MGAGHVGRAGGVDDGEMALFIEGFEGGQRGVEAEEAIEIKDLVLGNGNAGAHGVVILLTVGDDDVEAIGRAALEDGDETAGGGGGGLGQHRADKEAGNGRGAGDGEGAVAQEKSPVGLHGVPSFFAAFCSSGQLAFPRRLKPRYLCCSCGTDSAGVKKPGLASRALSKLRVIAQLTVHLPALKLRRAEQ